MGKNANAEDVAVLVKRLRDERGISLEQLAEHTGASVRTVYRWAEGKGALPVFARLIRALAAEHGLQSAV